MQLQRSSRDRNDQGSLAMLMFPVHIDLVFHPNIWMYMCFVACSAIFLQIFCRKSLGWLWLCSLAEGISLSFKNLKMNVETSVSGRRPVPWGKQDVFKHVWVFALTIWVSDRDYYVTTWLGILKIELCGPKPCPFLNQVIYWGAQWAQRHQSNTEPYRICSLYSIFLQRDIVWTL